MLVTLSLADIQREQLRRQVRQERERRATRADVLSFGEWLPVVSPSWRWEWPHLTYLQAQLERVTTGEINRLAIFMPPRHGKSEMTTIRYPVYRLERDPSIRVVVGSYSQDLAGEFSLKARVIARQRMALSRERNKIQEWKTGDGGGFLAVGVGNGVTGRGADLIVIDDPIKSRVEADSPAYRDRVWGWYKSDLFTRREPGAAVILIQTRWHDDDLAGRILNSEDGKNWTVVNLPAEAESDDPLGRAVGDALCPDRFDLAALSDIKTTIGRDYYALYQQRPQPSEGATYKRDWFTYANAPDDLDYVLQAWDTASKDSTSADYSACVTVGVKGTTCYVLDVLRAKLETPDLLAKVRSQAARWNPRKILIESASSGIGVYQTLRRETHLPVLEVAPERAGKLAHANSNTPYLESKRVVFCPGAWNGAFEDELLAFPSGKNDDQVDAYNIALSGVFARKKAKAYNGSGEE